MSPLGDLRIDHVGFAVDDLAEATNFFVNNYGLGVYAKAAGPDATDGAARMTAVGREGIRLLLTDAQGSDHPAAAYVERHGDGVSDIALSTADAAAAYAEAVRRGARPVAEPREHDGIVTATIGAFGDVTHTFVQRTADQEALALPGLTPVTGQEQAAPAATAVGLHTIDHFAVCLEAGQLDATVAYYETVLDFEMVFTERIVVGGQAMDSKVVQSRSGAVTLTLIEPDTSREPGQIDKFIKVHGGGGVQHIAFATDDIVRDVSGLGENGLAFLTTPGAYYEQVPERLDLQRHSVDALRELNILVDEDQDGQLLQIFTKSVHPRGTLFFEVIERLGARTFGSGNIKALYSAVELEMERARQEETGA
ncbi:4-hydroxyphenylpyruvate dioxygenase [Streptomyces sp. ISL-98]|uniref:4-hydroxyphenylpyruvate dioxygenase n=1 Tax=Streptomyces sp. ISL-98 TaxID=2819192 RepID=UPI001BE8FAB2|nr:4-hydroxyphenylpyruvate dioxygenase [Streptomyces sp. ISL-98]MBT2510503.1 4-hydroxyphenylpyruvate dioxygenase [Streptomyces sp. ISL-98]